MYTDRLEQLRKILIQKNLDSFLVSNFHNILYLTGFRTLSPDEREAFLVVTKNKIYLLSDGRYITKNPKSKFQIPNIEYRLIEPKNNLIKHLQKIVSENNLQALGFEAENLRFAEYYGLKQNIKELKLIPTERLVIKLREIKEISEIEKIKKACEIGDTCLTETIKTIKIGDSEKEIAFRIEFFLKEKGLNLAFSPIVAIDKSSCVPHYDTYNGTNENLKNQSIILIDMGVNYQNYNSDITRIVFFGKPDKKAMNIYDRLLLAQEQTIQQLKKIYEARQIDRFCRESLAKSALPIYPHSTGHGVGLEVHEYPKISSISNEQIEKNMAFTIEPGVYFPGKFGLRIEDTVWIKEGGIEVLTKFTKKPLII